MRWYELLQSMWQTRGVWEHAPPGNFGFEFLLDAIWWNLGQTRGVWEHAPPGNFGFEFLLDAIWWNLGLFVQI